MVFPMYFDNTFILLIIGMVLCLVASARVKSTFAKFSRVKHHAGLTGRDAAEQILRSAGIHDVSIEHISGHLTDHYDPRSRTVRLSDATYRSSSVAAIGVAAHECGHALQHAEKYMPLQTRGALVPVVNIGSKLAWPLIFIGFFFTTNASTMLINAGILLFSGVILFQLVTLPVEYNASGRAMRILSDSGMMYPEELTGARKVLNAAALTYLAAAAASILQLIRILLIRGRR